MATCIRCGARATIDKGCTRRVFVDGEWKILRIARCRGRCKKARLQEIVDRGETEARYIEASVSQREQQKVSKCQCPARETVAR